VSIFKDIILTFFLLFTLLLVATVLVNIFYVVPFVPSKKRVIEHVLKLADLKNGDKVFDLGCGDGRFLIEAEKKAKIIGSGYEIAPLPMILAQINKWVNGSKINLYMKSFFKADIKDADVIFCYLLPETMDKLAEKFKTECRKGTKIYSHTFSMRKMEPVKVWAQDKKLKLPTIYLYQI
jgi:ribosomal protein L11 methylase PrmA